MKRRLTIARSLVNKPDLLLLDEPTTGLDPQARHSLWDRLFRLKREGVTLVLTTHYMDEAEQLCDRLVVMDGGVIVAHGSPRQLIDEHSSREVTELRFATDDSQAPADQLADLADRMEVLPDRLLLYSDDGEAVAAAVHQRGLAPRSVLVRRSSLEDVFLRLTGRPWSTEGSPWNSSCAQVDYWTTVYRRTWRGSVVSSFLLPLLYLTAMGVGLGGYVDDAARSDALGGLTYLDYIAPGLLAATAMQTAVGEGMWPVMTAFKWQKTYHAMVATPLRARDILSAHLGFVAFRLLTTCGVFLVVLAAFGAIVSWQGALAALLVSVLVGMAHATPLFAFAAKAESPDGFAVLYRLGIMPMFLFSGAFFPSASFRKSSPGWPTSLRSGTVSS